MLHSFFTRLCKWFCDQTAGHPLSVLVRIVKVGVTLLARFRMMEFGMDQCSQWSPPPLSRMRSVSLRAHTTSAVSTAGRRGQAVWMPVNSESLFALNQVSPATPVPRKRPQRVMLARKLMSARGRTSLAKMRLAQARPEAASRARKEAARAARSSPTWPWARPCPLLHFT